MNLLSKKFYFENITIGSWLTLYNTGMAEIFSKNKFDWLVVDLEHSTITLEQASELIRIIDLCGSRPIVRLTSNDADLAKRVLDSGAHGIIVPMINSKEEAMRAIENTKYMPDGTRGVGLARAQSYGNEFNKYLEWQKKEILVIAQVEHIRGVNNIEEIISVEGLDGVFIGPYDLSSSLEKPGDFGSKKFVDAVNIIKSALKPTGKILGYHVVEPDEEKVRQAIIDGFNFISFSVDIRLLDSNIKKSLQKIRNK